jgi:hypothetical protein
MEILVIEELSKMIEGRVVVSSEEIRRKAVRAALRALGVKISELDFNFINEVSCSFTECPLTLKSLHFPETVKVGEVTFYHLHTQKPDKKEIEEAYGEYLTSKSYLERVEVMREITDKFFRGYDAKGEVLRIYSKKHTYGVFYSTIDDVYEDIRYHLDLSKSFNGEYVVVVPTEEKINPFLRFFKRYSEDVKKVEMKIWVANTENKTIDPFIGYPKDFLLLKGFKNPRAASMVNSLWRVDVEEID